MQSVEVSVGQNAEGAENGYWKDADEDRTKEETGVIHCESIDQCAAGDSAATKTKFGQKRIEQAVKEPEKSSGDNRIASDRQ